MKMHPEFLDFFKSFYYTNTYLPPVDLSEQVMSKQLLDNEDKKTADVAKKLISDPEVQKIFSEPLTFDFPTIRQKNKILQNHGFRILAKKTNPYTRSNEPFYSVLEHPQLPGWVIKLGTRRIPKDQLTKGPTNLINEMAQFSKDDSLLRIAMANRIRDIAMKENIELIVPGKKFVHFAAADKPSRSYFIVSEKLPLLSAQDTFLAIQKMTDQQQSELAHKLVTLIQKAGVVDATLSNFRLTPQGKLAIIDTEPAGLMVKENKSWWNRLFTPRGASLEKCGRIGMRLLFEETHDRRISIDPNLKPNAFEQEVYKEYEKNKEPTLSQWKIALSVASCGIFALIVGIASLVKVYQLHRTFGKIHALPDAHPKWASLVRQVFSDIEGVPYVGTPII
jgi:hypothetical protein